MSACVWLKVTDTGIGMTPEQLARVVLPFQQADASTTRKFGGSGLGLAICSELVALLHGEFAYASTAGVGSVFVVAIPCGLVNVATAAGAPASASKPATSGPTERAENATSGPTERAENASLAPAPQEPSAPSSPTPSVQARTPSPPPPADLHATSPPPPAQTHPPLPSPAPSTRTAAAERPVVLIADDNSLNIRVLQRQLERCGYDAVVARDGRECVEMVRAYLKGQQEPGQAPGSVARLDAILMDLNMPELDGISAARAVRDMEADDDNAVDGHSRRPLPIFAVTADDPELIWAACKEAGMNGFLQKPVVMTDLAATLERVRVLEAPAGSSDDV